MIFIVQRAIRARAIKHESRLRIGLFLKVTERAAGKVFKKSVVLPGKPELLLIHTLSGSSKDQRQTQDNQNAERVECGGLAPLWFVYAAHEKLPPRRQAAALHTLRASG